MAGSTAYYTLVTSLPHLPFLFDNKQLPCSRIQLDRRLSMLTDADRQQLELMESLLWWDRQGHIVEPDDVTSARQRKHLAQLHHPLLRGFAEWRLELRTLIAGLRLRRRQGVPPPQGWGVGRWSERMRNNWQAPVFGLEFCFPFALELRQLMEQDQSFEAEKLLLGQLWYRLSRLQDNHYFDFEAVALYVMRWHLIERWIHNRRDEAVARFDHLVEQALDLQGNEF